MSGIQYINGVRRNYGPRLAENEVGSVTNTLGSHREVAIDFDYAHLPGAHGPALDGNVGQDIEVGELTGTQGAKYLDNLVVVVPSYSQIISVRLVVLTPFAGGTSLKFGVVNSDNTAATNDGSTNGLLTATVGVLANINATGKWVTGDGALINPATGNGVGLGAGADPAAANGVVIKAVAAGTFTAGTARLLVEYIPPIEALS